MPEFIDDVLKALEPATQSLETIESDLAKPIKDLGDSIRAAAGPEKQMLTDAKTNMEEAVLACAAARHVLNRIKPVLEKHDGARPGFVLDLTDALQDLEIARDNLQAIDAAARVDDKKNKALSDLKVARTALGKARNRINSAAFDAISGNASDDYTKAVLRDRLSLRGISPDPGLDDELVMLGGFVGKSRLGDNYRRLFVSKQLNEFLDFRAEDVVRVLLTGEELTDISYVWVKKSAVVYHTRIRSVNQQVVFLQGAISDGANQQGNNQPSANVQPGTLGNRFGSFADPVPSIVDLGCGGTSNMFCS